MGCCISKCRPKNKHSIEEFNNVQDKLVISQAPKTPNIIPPSNKISPSPPSPSNSTSSVSSFTCTTSNTSNTISSCSSLSSTSSSALSSKDRSFSNDFLWACVKENPHIVRINSIKERSLSLAPAKSHAKKLHSSAKPFVAQLKQAVPQRKHSSTSQKRVRSSSPTIVTRQKSFRKEPDELNSSSALPSRTTLRSPSPSRRFNADNGRGILSNMPKETCSKPMQCSKVCAVNSFSSSMGKENFRPASPNNSSRRLRPCLRSNRETCTHRIGSKIDEIAVKEALSHYDSDSIPMEDIDNPLISLDCFIFI